MPAKTVPLSVRISQEDAEFIARLKLPGTTTPSDKIRAILAEARRRGEGPQDYPGALQLSQDSLAPALRRLREAEHGQQMHSELVSRIGEWLPEAVAFLIAQAAATEKGEGQALHDLEKGLADRVFTLMQSVLQLGLTRRCPCYQPEAVGERLGSVLDLAALISQTRQTTEEKNNE